MRPDISGLNIFVVGLGQAGGNLATEFFRRGYNCVALNTAYTDLATIAPGIYEGIPDGRRMYIGLNGEDGAACNPMYAHECLLEHARDIRNFVRREAEDTDLVLICAGLGGGTGSAVASLIDVLQSEDLPIMTMLALPAGHESPMAKSHALVAMDEVCKRNIASCILVDNERLTALNPDLSILNFYREINAKVIEPIDSMNGLNGRLDSTPIRVFDGADYRRFLFSGGFLNYATLVLDELTVESVATAMSKDLMHSDLMPYNFSFQSSAHLGIVIESDASTLAQTPYRVFRRIAETINEFSRGAAIYYGIYKTQEGQGTTLRFIVSSMTAPESLLRLRGEIGSKNRLLEQGSHAETLDLDSSSLDIALADQELSSQVTSPVSDLYTTDLEEVSLGFDEESSANREQISEVVIVKDITTEELLEETDLLQVPTPDAKHRSQAAEMSSSFAPPITVIKSQDLYRYGRKLEAVKLLRSGSNMAAKNEYADLVYRLTHTRHEEEKKVITDRLLQDSYSADDSVRLEAVMAMAQAGYRIFGEALMRATEDDNEEVRSVAAKALRS